MHYLGGKHRMAKHIAPVLMANMRPVYVEPFVGAGSIFCSVTAQEMRAYDAHEDLILLWKALRDGWVPPKEVSEEDYASARNSPPSALRGFIGFACSFSGKWFGGYARDQKGIPRRDYAGVGARSILKKVKKLENKNVVFEQSDYRHIVLPDSATVYADPPYASTTGYSRSIPFDHTVFWNWVKDHSNPNRIIFVSEYTAPSGFVSILDIPRTTDMRDKDNQRMSVMERLFVHESVLDHVKGVDDVPR